MKVLLDTNAYSAMRRGERWIVDKVQNAEKVSMSAVVVGELLFGFHNGNRFEQNLEKLEGFLAQPKVEFLPVTWLTAQRFGQIAAALRRKGRPQSLGLIAAPVSPACPMPYSTLGLLSPRSALYSAFP